MHKIEFYFDVLSLYVRINDFTKFTINIITLAYTKLHYKRRYHVEFPKDDTKFMRFEIR